MPCLQQQRTIQHVTNVKHKNPPEGYFPAGLPTAAVVGRVPPGLGLVG